jgi:hypothetical protein
MRHQQKNSRQSFFAGIEKLIDQVILISDVSFQQVFDKQGRQFWFYAHCLHHRRPLDVQQNAVSQSCCRRHAEKLTSKTTFAKEIALAQDAKGCFSPVFRYHTELHPSGLDEE